MDTLIDRENRAEIKKIFGNQNFRVFYIDNNISFKNILHKIAVDFSLKYNLKHKISEKDKNNTEITFFAENENQFLISFSAFFVDRQDFIIIQPPSKKITGITSFKLLYLDNFYKNIETTIYEQHSQIHKERVIRENYFVKEAEINFLNFFSSRKEKDETLLACFRLKSTEKKTSSKHSYYYVVTDNDKYLIEFNENFFVEKHIKLSEKTPVEITKSNIVIENKLYSLKTAKTETFALADACPETEKRITYFASKNKNYKLSSVSEELLKIQVKKHDLPEDKFALQYFFGQIEENSESEVKFTEILQTLTFRNNFEEIIADFFKIWEIKIDEQISILQLFISTAADKKQLDNIYPIYYRIKEKYIENTKEKIDKTIFLLSYCEFLIKSSHFSEAEDILVKILEKTSTKTDYEIIESKAIITQQIENPKILKIKTLDLLAQTVESEKKQEYLTQSARLQPLNIEKIEQLIKNSSIEESARAKEIYDILSSPLQKREQPYLQEYNKLPKETIKNILQHPISKNKKRIYNFQKWLSKIETEDYTKIRQFAEELTEKNKPDTHKNITRIAESLQIPYIEIFVSKGRKALGITTYEGNPNFMLIGNKHLNKESEYYLNPQETAFAAASELSHIFFKHTKLSSSDIWRGTADKGIFFIDSLINIIPYSGLITKYTKNINGLNAVSNFLSKSEKLKSISKALNESKKINEYYKKIIPKSKKASEKQKLLDASRIMQYTADRTGIVFSGNLQDSLTSIIKTSQYYSTKANKIYDEHFFNDLINNKEITDSELSLRISNLFTFYLSPEYKTIRKQLIK